MLLALCELYSTPQPVKVACATQRQGVGAVYWSRRLQTIYDKSSCLYHTANRIDAVHSVKHDHKILHSPQTSMHFVLVCKRYHENSPFVLWGNVMFYYTAQNTHKGSICSSQDILSIKFILSCKYLNVYYTLYFEISKQYISSGSHLQLQALQST